MALKRDGWWLPSWRARRSPWWRPGLWCIALALALCLPNWPASAQGSPPTSRLGPADYQTFQADWLTVKLQQAASRQALEQALSEKRLIEQNLSETQRRLEALLASEMQHSDDWKKLYEQLLQELATLRQHLSESDSTVAELQTSLESAEKRYDQELRQAQDRARRLELENTLLKIGCGLLAGTALGLGIWAAAK